MQSDSKCVEMKGNDKAGSITLRGRLQARRFSNNAGQIKAKVRTRDCSLSPLRAKKDDKDEADEDDQANPSFGNFRHKNHAREGRTSPARQISISVQQITIHGRTCSNRHLS
jgi:hypothetical protein